MGGKLPSSQHHTRPCLHSTCHCSAALFTPSDPDLTTMLKLTLTLASMLTLMLMPELSPPLSVILSLTLIGTASMVPSGFGVSLRSTVFFAWAPH